MKPVAPQLEDLQELGADLILFDRLTSARRANHVDDLSHGLQRACELDAERLTLRHRHGWMLSP